MEEKDPGHINPSIPEALDPDIGNGALWQTDKHQFILRSADPAKKMDELLLDESTRESIINKWNGKEDDKPIDQPALFGTETPALEEIEKELPEPKPKEKQVLSRNKIKKESRVEWEEENESGPSEPDSTQKISSHGISQNKEEPLPTESKPIGKVGKRVRKVIKNVQPKQDQTLTPENTKVSTSSMDSNLSPFTFWLKSLKGSEYVHPYEDDYALD